jgi:tRNA threonylcarbamoyladenosine modification (KEOPS) complex Cgi121 subunit
MAEHHRVPWFPAWGVRFPQPLDNPQDVVSIFNEWRPDNRWVLVSFSAAASEIHLWTVWHALRRRELQNLMVGNSVDTEFLRLISGTHQIRTAFERAGLQQNDEAAWIVYLPEFGSDDPFGSQEETGIKIPRDTYNSLSQEANRLKLHLNAELITQRPIPTMEGLERLGFESEIANSTPEDLESAFLLHAAMSDLNT